MAQDLQKLIEVLSKKTGKDVKTLQAEIDGFYNEAKTLYPTADEKTWLESAQSSFTANYRKILSPFGAGSEFSAVFIGYSDFDKAKKLKAEILAEYKKDPIGAFKVKMVNEKGEPLYWAPMDEVAKMEDWQKKKLGTVIPEVDMKRTVIGVAMEDGKMVDMELTLGDTCWDKPIELNKSVLFKASKNRGSSPEHLRLFGTKNIEFVYGEQLKDKGIETILTEFFKAKNINFANVGAYSQTEEGKKFGAFIINKVKVIDIAPVLSKNGQRMIRVQDSSMDIIDEKGEIVPPIRCFVPAEIPVDYTERASIYVIGRVTMDKQTGKYTTMNVYGIYTPEVFRDLKKSLPVESEPTSSEKLENFGDAF